jgi:hypothetical protein
MGYDVQDITIGIKVSNNQGEEQHADQAALEDLVTTIEAVVASEPRFARIVTEVRG